MPKLTSPTLAEIEAHKWEWHVLLRWRFPGLPFPWFTGPRILHRQFRWHLNKERRLHPFFRYALFARPAGSTGPFRKVQE